MATAMTLELRGLDRREMRDLTAQARRLGLTPEDYVRRLVEENLALAREAREKTFTELTRPGRAVDEAEVDQLVERAKARHHRSVRTRR